MASQIAKMIARDVLAEAGIVALSDDATRNLLHNIDVSLAPLRDCLLDCDSNLSAYGHGRPLTKKEALRLSETCRTLWGQVADVK